MNITKQELQKYAHSYKMYDKYRENMILTLLLTLFSTIIIIFALFKGLPEVGLYGTPMLILENLTIYLNYKMANIHAEIITSIINKFEEDN